MSQKILYFPSRDTSAAAMVDFSRSWQSADQRQRHAYEMDILEISKERTLDANVYLGAVIVLAVSGTFWAGIVWMASRLIR